MLDRVYPNDRQALCEWELYGPKNPAIFELVDCLAACGLRLSEIATLIEASMRLKLVELDASAAALEA